MWRFHGPLFHWAELVVIPGRKPLGHPDSSRFYMFLPNLRPRRSHEARASAFFIYGIIHIHIGCQLCSVQRLDKKRNKPVWSGEGSREIKRFEAPFAHEYLMPIWGESDWSSVRSRRCRRKSTLSASGHCLTVPCINGPSAAPAVTKIRLLKQNITLSSCMKVLYFHDWYWSDMGSENLSVRSRI